MRLNVDRYGIDITPENVQDEAFLEEVLGLKEGGATAVAYRVNAIGLSRIAYMRITKEEVGK